MSDHGFTSVPQQRAFEGIVGQIERAMLDGTLGVGDRLPSERELAQQFGVSRASVREALRVLEGYGLLRAKRGSGQGSGLTVAPTDRGFADLLRLHASVGRVSLDDLLEIRVLIEGWAAGLAAARADADATRTLKVRANAMRSALTPETFLQHDTDFHLAIARASGNLLAPLIMAALREAIAHRMLEAFNTLPHWDQERERLVDEHATIAELIAAGKVAESERSIREHITRFYEGAFGDTQGGGRPS